MEKQEYLSAYANTYLKEEIREEQIVRNLEPFIRFLEVAAQCNGTILNQSKIARDSGTDSKTIERYYSILVDTLIGYFLEPYHRSVRKRQSKRSKFFFFDLGVKRALENTLTVPVQPKTSGYGRSFEHFFILECFRFNDYHRTKYKFSYLMTKDDLEVDLIVERPGKTPVLIEIKSGVDVDEVEIGRYQKIKRDLEPCEFWVVSQVAASRKGLFYEVLPWKAALTRLFTND
ncbi:MAG: DUF4143 domain-containing protein [Deltaproteobacteria bacterium]|nr:DUF4143 domain-containing protein [Deltaproteobacteria bacterium]